jgi:hypothetical protein
MRSRVPVESATSYSSRSQGSAVHQSAEVRQGREQWVTVALMDCDRTLGEIVYVEAKARYAISKLPEGIHSLTGI